MKTVWLDLPVCKEVSNIELIGCRAAILGHTAYPGDERKVKEITKALRRLHGLPQRCSISHRMMDEMEAERVIRNAIETIYRERAVAAIGYLTTYEKSFFGGDNKGITSFASDGAYLAGLKLGAPVHLQRPSLSEKNFLSRCWKETMPVLHMAVALQGLLFSGETVDFDQVVTSALWVQDAIKWGELHRNIMIAISKKQPSATGWDQRLNFDEKMAIRFAPRQLAHELLRLNYEDATIQLFHDLPETWQSKH